MPLTTDDKIAIGEVLSAYCFLHLDHGRWDEMRALFTEDARLDFGALMGVHEGREGIRAWTQMMSNLGLFMRHYCTNILIEGDSPRATARSDVLALTGIWAAEHRDRPLRGPAGEGERALAAPRTGRHDRRPAAGLSG